MAAEATGRKKCVNAKLALSQKLPIPHEPCTILPGALAAENAVRDKAYEQASGGVDTAEGILGKKHPTAKKLRALRGAMNPQKPKKPAAPK